MQINLITRYPPMCRELTRESRLYDDTNDSLTKASPSHEMISASVYHRQRLFSYRGIVILHNACLLLTNDARVIAVGIREIGPVHRRAYIQVTR